MQDEPEAGRTVAGAAIGELLTTENTDHMSLGCKKAAICHGSSLMDVNRLCGAGQGPSGPMCPAYNAAHTCF